MDLGWKKSKNISLNQFLELLVEKHAKRKSQYENYMNVVSKRVQVLEKALPCPNDVDLGATNEIVDVPKSKIDEFSEDLFLLNDLNEKSNENDVQMIENSNTYDIKELSQVEETKSTNEQVLEEEIEREIKKFQECPFPIPKRSLSPVQKESILEELESSTKNNDYAKAESTDEKSIEIILEENDDQEVLEIYEEENLEPLAVCSDCLEPVLVENFFNCNSELMSRSNESLYKYTDLEENFFDKRLVASISHLLNATKSLSLTFTPQIETKFTIEFKIETQEVFPMIEPMFYDEKIEARPKKFSNEKPETKNLFNQFTNNFFKLVQGTSSTKTSINIFDMSFISRLFDVNFEKEEFFLTPKNGDENKIENDHVVEPDENEKFFGENSSFPSACQSFESIDLPVRVSKCTSCLPCQALYDMGTEMFHEKNEIHTQTPSSDSNIELLFRVAHTQTEDDLYDLHSGNEIFFEEVVDKDFEIEVELGNEYLEINLETIERPLKSEVNEASIQAELDHNIISTSLSLCSICNNCFGVDSEGDFVRKNGKYFCLSCFQQSLINVSKDPQINVYENNDKSLQVNEYLSYFCTEKIDLEKNLTSMEAGGDSDFHQTSDQNKFDNPNFVVFDDLNENSDQEIQLDVAEDYIDNIEFPVNEIKIQIVEPQRATISEERQRELSNLIQNADRKARLRIRGNLQRILSICHVGTRNETIVKNALNLLEAKILDDENRRRKVSHQDSVMSLPTEISLEYLKRSKSKNLPPPFLDPQFLSIRMIKHSVPVLCALLITTKISSFNANRILSEKLCNLSEIKLYKKWAYCEKLSGVTRKKVWNLCVSIIDIVLFCVFKNNKN